MKKQWQTPTTIVSLLTSIGLLWTCYNRSYELTMEKEKLFIEKEKLWKAENRIEFQESWIQELREPK